MTAAAHLPSDLCALYPFAPHWLETPAGRLHYVDEGPRDAAAAVICVHGNPTWSFFYRDIIKSLAKNFRVLAPDHLGCGLSDKPQTFSYRLADHIENLAQLAATLPQPTLHFIVHDWGGAIGLGVAERFAARVGKLVVMNTAAFPGPCPLRIRVCRWPGVGPLLVRGLNGFAGPAACMAVAKPLSANVKRGFLYPYRSWADRVAVYNFVKDIPLESSHPSLPALNAVESGLEKLRHKPMLLAWGLRDFCFTPAYLVEWRRRFPSAVVREFPDCGHYLPEDAGPELVSVVAAFVSR
ncbi:MAG TPA: alpha/beta fold hydrolase [Opitutales bacterium]|nr:alpha/beta fold hydrolase [Opitutales bacterium]